MLSNYISNQANDGMSAIEMLDIQPVQIKNIIEFGIPCMINQRSNEMERNHVCGYFMGYESIRSYVPYFFVPATNDDEIGYMLTSDNFNVIGRFERGDKYMFYLFEEFKENQIARVFADKLNKKQPKLAIEEAGLMNKVDQHNKMKILSGNEWYKQNHINQNEPKLDSKIKTIEQSNRLSVTDDVLSREPRVNTKGIKRKLDEKYEDETDKQCETAVEKTDRIYKPPRLKHKINGQDLDWATVKTSGVKNKSKFKGFVPVEFGEDMVTAINSLFSINDELKPYMNEHLLPSMEDLNDRMLQSQDDYYDSNSLMNNKDYYEKLKLVKDLLHSPQALKNVYYNVSDNKDFQEPFEKELNKLRSTGTINSEENVENLPNDAMVVELLTLFTKKRDNTVKARVCARGDILKNRKGEIIEDPMKIDSVFMSTLRESIIAHLHYVLMCGHHCAQIDISNAYLNGDLPFSVYVRNPEKKGYLKLNKALYGLAISGRIWFALIHSILISLGCINKSEGLYYQPEKQVYAMLYVDDILITGVNKEPIEDLIMEINNIFELKRSQCCIDGKNKYNFDYVGVDIEYERLHYMRIKCEFKEKLETLQYGSNDKIDLPGDPHFKLKNKELDKGSKNQISENDGYKVDPKILNYAQRVVGLIQYVSSFRPDVAYYVNMMSIAVGQKKIYKKVLKQIMILGEYLYNTADEYIEWKYHENLENEVEVTCYCDASLGLDSRSGYFIYVNGNPMFWSSKKIKNACSSSAEAEINAVYNACLPIMFAKSWYKHNYGMKVKVRILTDATAILDGMYKNSSTMNDTKKLWYALRKQKVTDIVQSEDFDLEKIDTKINVADILTKATTKEQFNRLKKKIIIGKIDFG